MENTKATYPEPVESGTGIIDLRDVTDRVEHLEKLRQPGPVDLGPTDNSCDQDSLFAELALLESLLDELRSCGGDHEWRGDWYPATLILDSYMMDYAKDTAEDIGAISSEYSWPSSHIDWDSALAAFKQDYAEVEYDGNLYYYR